MLPKKVNEGLISKLANADWESTEAPLRIVFYTVAGMVMIVTTFPFIPVVMSAVLLPAFVLFVVVMATTKADIKAMLWLQTKFKIKRIPGLALFGVIAVILLATMGFLWGSVMHMNTVESNQVENGTITE